MLITVAHSPDADDAFMFYSLAKEKIDTGSFTFRHVLKDIETLNHEALKGIYEVTAISFHAYPLVSDRYALMTCGSSIGDGYGPIIVSEKPMTIKDLKGARIAAPGPLTTACLLLRLFLPDANIVQMNFDEIISAIKSGKIDAGLIIHEGQINYMKDGLHKVIDLGEWWQEETGLPLPLGGNVVRRDVPNGKEVARLIKESIVYSLAHEDEAIDYALGFGRGIEKDEAKRFVRMYVNDFTVDIGENGKKAVELLLRKGFEAGIIEKKTTVDWIEA
ncbi:MAG: ABC transporter substrate-binding protein [Syntrophus sp. (in: bacteria)]|nr:ABC transporter substrate-binding protein [Syntrophus sp. (in: bacteria)]